MATIVEGGGNPSYTLLNGVIGPATGTPLRVRGDRFTVQVDAGSTVTIEASNDPRVETDPTNAEWTAVALVGGTPDITVSGLYELPAPVVYVRALADAGTAPVYVWLASG